MVLICFRLFTILFSFLEKKILDCLLYVLVLMAIQHFFMRFCISNYWLPRRDINYNAHLIREIYINNFHLVNTYGGWLLIPEDITTQYLVLQNLQDITDIDFFKDSIWLVLNFEIIFTFPSCIASCNNKHYVKLTGRLKYHLCII